MQEETGCRYVYISSRYRQLAVFLEVVVDSLSQLLLQGQGLAGFSALDARYHELLGYLQIEMTADSFPTPTARVGSCCSYLLRPLCGAV